MTAAPALPRTRAAAGTAAGSAAAAGAVPIRSLGPNRCERVSRSTKARRAQGDDADDRDRVHRSPDGLAARRVVRDLEDARDGNPVHGQVDDDKSAQQVRARDVDEVPHLPRARDGQADARRGQDLADHQGTGHKGDHGKCEQDAHGGEQPAARRHALALDRRGRARYPRTRQDEMGGDADKEHNPEHLVQKVAGQLEEHLHDEQGGKNRIERDAGFERVRFRAHERYLSHGESCLG